MQFAVACYLILLAVIVLIVMMRDHLRGQVELLSIRNFALLGFIVFQLTSGAIVLYRDYDPKYPLYDPAGTGLVFAIQSTLFLIILFIFYRWGLGVRKIAWALPTTRVVPSEAFMLLCAVTLTGLALALRVFVAVPLVASLADYLGTAFAAIACGLAGWTWAKRFLNPAAAVYAMMIFMGSSAAVVIGSFGRRGLVAVGAGLLWGMYYSRWRYSDPRRVIAQIAVAGAVPLLALALYTSARSSSEHDRNAIQHVQAMVTQGDLKTGFMLLLDGQGTAGVSMWLMEHCPTDFPYRWMHTPLYTVYFPIPRSIWAGKPDPLSGRIAEMANRSGVNRKVLTIGPGIIGHAAAEGGWIALIVYAMLAGLCLRLYDEIVRKCPTSPFVVLPIGASLGQVVGLARGETAAFAFTYAFASFGSYLSLLFVAKIVERTGLAGTADSGMIEDEHAEEWSEHEPHEEPASDHDGHRRVG